MCLYIKNLQTYLDCKSFGRNINTLNLSYAQDKNETELFYVLIYAVIFNIFLKQKLIFSQANKIWKIY